MAVRGGCMAKFTIKGIDDYVAALERVDKNSEETIKEAIYDGAAIVADAIKAGLQSLPIDEGENGLQRYGTPDNPVNGVSRRQKADLIASMGLAPIQRFNADINTKVGWDGYGSIKTKAHPQGVPNVLLMRAVESGTSFMKKNPVIRKAVNKVHAKAEEAIKNKIDEKIKKEMS